jgi:N-acetylglucosaminyl-diphospho-decaprenol L-rhamnosyltransferase
MESVATANKSMHTKPIPDMSIVIVCWNDKKYLDPCLQSLRKAGLSYGHDVIVVDNGSTDGSKEMLKKLYPDVGLIQNEVNVGLGKATNQGIQATRGRYVLLLNNDTLVEGSSLNAMVEFLDGHPESGAVGGRLLNPDGSFQAGGSRFPSLITEFLCATRLEKAAKDNSRTECLDNRAVRTDWIGSACLLLRRSALEKIGLLDEEYFIYGDETDLQYRMANAGWAVFYMPQVHTVHYGGASMDRWRRRKMVYRGKMLFFRKNYGRIRAGALRLMLGILSFFKLFLWGAGFLFAADKTRIRCELRSNVDVIKLCWKLV